MLSLRDFTYHLPQELIAQTPVEPRDSSRLLVLDKQTSVISHHHYTDLPTLLHPTDILVRNNTRVIPARIIGTKSTGGAVELLLTKAIETSKYGEKWECLTKPGLKVGQVLSFPNSELTATCIEVLGFTRLIQFNQKHVELMLSLDAIGQTPLPPYITWNENDEEALRQRYQTVYATYEGSVAAPTAGLHFTHQLDTHLKAKGIQIEEVTLHVGLGTFLPVKTDDISQHEMHKEWYEVKPEVASRLNKAKENGQRIIAVGTTTCRVLETCTQDDGTVQAGTGETAIFMYPPYRFKGVDGLITNFHLPQSTLLMLLSAFVSQPNTPHAFTDFQKSSVGHAYQVAIAQKYRFFSFGDGMLVI